MQAGHLSGRLMRQCPWWLIRCLRQAVENEGTITSKKACWRSNRFSSTGDGGFLRSIGKAALQLHKSPEIFSCMKICMAQIPCKNITIFIRRCLPQMEERQCCISHKKCCIPAAFKIKSYEKNILFSNSYAVLVYREFCVPAEVIVLSFSYQSICAPCFLIFLFCRSLLLL